MFIVFTQHISTRLEYIVKTIFGNETIVTRDVLKFSNSSLQKINYSSTNFNSDSLWIVPIGLLEQNTIENQDITCFEWNGLTVFFKSKGTVPFDFFSAAFYLLTRYEEYFEGYKKDDYGNYHHENSVAYKENFLHLPIINLWLKEIVNIGKFSTEKSSFKVLPTYDVDIAFAYKNHSFLKNIGGFVKDILHKRGTFIERLRVLLNYQKDPFNVFSWLENLHSQQQLQPIYFFLVASNKSKFDKNVPAKSKGMIELIKQIAKKNVIGIHPSFVSNTNKQIVESEIKSLAKITNTKINISRQHYLQLSFPITYQTLLELGISEDYTLGYGTKNGFRASYAKPFFWYNLKEEKQTSLLLHPFCYMDANSIFEQKLSAETALQEMEHYYEIAKKVDGSFIFIMHNHFLANQTKWNMWRATYEKFLQKIR